MPLLPTLLSRLYILSPSVSVPQGTAPWQMKHAYWSHPNSTTTTIAPHAIRAHGIDIPTVSLNSASTSTQHLPPADNRQPQYGGGPGYGQQQYGGPPQGQYGQQGGYYPPAPQQSYQQPGRTFPLLAHTSIVHAQNADMPQNTTPSPSRNPSTSNSPRLSKREAEGDAVPPAWRVVPVVCL